MLKKVSGFLLLTEHMAEKLSLDVDDFIVVEGIASDVDSSLCGMPGISDKKIVFYSGTLAFRYGIRDLIDAFLKVESADAELWICGDGDSKSYVEKAAMLDFRIKLFGQIPREEVIKLQAKATVLVNPRSSAGEYTKYSFPSKIMEYMSTGIPVIMHALPGIPKDYLRFCFLPKNESVDGLKECIENVLFTDIDELRIKGLAAKEFVSEHKSSYIQALRIKNFIGNF